MPYTFSNNFFLHLLDRAMRVHAKVQICSLPPPTEVEKELVRRLKDDFSRMEWDQTGKYPSEQVWYDYLRKMRDFVKNEDPRMFLRWRPIRETMFFDYVPHVAHELKLLRGNPEWSTRYAPAIQESGAGCPRRYPLFPQSSGNMIHGAFHVSNFERTTGTRVSDYDYIVEFGGGYGCMRRVMAGLGFSGRYIIYDFPCFIALQRFYTAMSGGGETEGVTSPAELRQALASKQGAKGLFVAAWSISETPVDFRAQYLPMVDQLSAYLVVYADRFQEVDNTKFFREWSQSNRTAIRWTHQPLAYLRSTYLFGGPGDY